MIPMWRPFLLLLILTLAQIAPASPAGPVSAPSNEPRVALVIGNAAYPGSPVKDAVSNARVMDQALTRLGFRVTRRENAGFRDMVEALHDFGDTMSRSHGTALFYFCGQGLQVEGSNYLLPVDADYERALEIKYRALQLNQVLETMDGAHTRVSLVILDAARGNRFIKELRSLSQGLAQMDAPEGTLLALSSAPNTLAPDDGNQADSARYTQALLANMGIPGLPVEQVFKRVRVDVMQKTHGAQVPWENSSLTGDFYFLPGPDGVPAAAPQAIHGLPSVPAGKSREIAAWERIKDSQDPRDYRAFLAQFPNGDLRTLARFRLMRYQGTMPSEGSVAGPLQSTPPRSLAVPPPPPPLPVGAYDQTSLTPPPPLAAGTAAYPAPAESRATAQSPPPPPLASYDGVGLGYSGTAPTPSGDAATPPPSLAPYGSGPARPPAVPLPLGEQPAQRPPPLPMPPVASYSPPSPVVPSSPTAGLLAKARDALAANRLTTPEDDSALKWCEAVLAIDADNQEATGILRRVMDRYLTWSSGGVARGDPGKARVYLARAAQMERYASPNQRKKLALLQARIADLEAPPATDSQPAAHAGSQGPAAALPARQSKSFFEAFARDWKKLWSGKGDYSSNRGQGPDLRSIGH
jgi:Caspase domain